jgi:hypothetical protein
MTTKIIILIIFIPFLIYSQDTTETDLYTRFFKETDKINNWVDFRNYYNNNKIMDDGVVAEIFSEISEKLFTNQFKFFFQSNIINDRKFQSFVINHVDETWGEENLISFKSNLDNKCPNKYKRKCRFISARLDSILSIQNTN